MGCNNRCCGPRGGETIATIIIGFYIILINTAMDLKMIEVLY